MGIIIIIVQKMRRFWWVGLSIYLFVGKNRFFKECPHPDDKQRKELSRELNLEPLQVKFWFQNKRTQMKVLHELLLFFFCIKREREREKKGLMLLIINKYCNAM